MLSTIAHSAQPGKGYELIFFGSAEANRTDPDQLPASNDALASADILYSLTRNRFRLLGELIVATEETELERFQVGWLPHETTWLFAGRYHQPTNYWASIYHHGQYLQTSITRPNIEGWEDDYGVLQTHQTGLMVESNFGLRENTGLEIAISYGSGSEIGDGVLEPFDMLDGTGMAGASFAARIGFLPDILGNNAVGVLFGKSELESSDSQVIIPDLVNVNQDVVGAFLNWTAGSWHMISAAYHLQNKLDRETLGTSDSFTAGYVQLEKSISDWTLYGRWENTAGAEESDYLALFPDYVVQRSLIGVRLDFMKQHAVTLELFDAENGAGDFRKIAIQWSAAFR
ncbi:MAG: hypothetical protein MUP90_15910 [Gammaproteobacteria bacterium]|nr:hypothetical protein [Gammaproteobacteria bacterium]